jgi:hypothetical protein
MEGTASRARSPTKANQTRAETMTKPARTPKPKSAIIYSGPSLIDGAPIVCVAIVTSGNVKTGNMIQTHIIRADMDPLQASKTGADFAICGNCKHRGTATTDSTRKQAQGRTCYVNLGQGPNQVFKAYSAGKYSTATPEQVQAIGRARMVRLGTYGDPAAVPAAIWDQLLKEAAGHTGYTHQHDKSPDYSRMMHSADTAAEALQAHRASRRTFRVIPLKQWQDHGTKALLNTEILCPASKEAGQRVTCDKCKLCSGSQISAKSVAIVAHGTAKAGV